MIEQIWSECFRCLFTVTDFWIELCATPQCECCQCFPCDRSCVLGYRRTTGPLKFDGYIVWLAAASAVRRDEA